MPVYWFISVPADFLGNPLFNFHLHRHARRSFYAVVHNLAPSAWLQYLGREQTSELFISSLSSAFRLHSGKRTAEMWLHKQTVKPKGHNYEHSAISNLKKSVQLFRLISEYCKSTPSFMIDKTHHGVLLKKKKKSSATGWSDKAELLLNIVKLASN